MKKEYIIGFLTGLVLLFSANAIAGNKTVSVELFGIRPDNGKDVTPAVRTALEYCAQKGINKLTFPKGRYDFYPDQAVEKTVYISNNTDGEKRIAFSLDRFTDFEIDGQGAEFIFHGYICPFIIENSQNIRLKNFSIDYVRTFHSEGTILAVHKDEIEITFPKEYPFVVNNERLVFTDGSKEKYPYHNLLEYDPAKKETAYQVQDHYLEGPVLKAQEIGPGQVRLWLDNIKATPGNIMVFAPGHRLCPGITLDNTKNIEIAGVTIHHSGGMAIIAQLCRDINIRQVQVVAPQNRIISATADATHFSNCEGKIAMTNCLFANQMDDATNVHGIYMRIEEITSPKSLLLKLVHYEQFGMDILKKGQSVELVNYETVETYATNVVKSVKRLNKEYYQIEFTQDLPTQLRVKDVVGSASTPEVLLKDCVCKNNRARGVLLGSRNKIVVEGNTFHNPGAAIMTGGDTEYWFEQGGVTNLFIRNNIFDNCNYGVWGSAAICIAGGAKDAAHAPRLNRNIVIENNVFKVFDPRLLDASSVDNLIFRNNKVEQSTAYPAIHTDADPINVRHSSNVSIIPYGSKEKQIEQSFFYENPSGFSYPYENTDRTDMIRELRDPCIIRDGDMYYLVYTHYPFTHHTSMDPGTLDYNSSPGIRLYSSKDLKNWSFEKWLVKSGDLPEDCPYKHRFWAPEIRKMNGKYYLIFYADNWIKDEYNCAGERGYVAFVGVANSITGPYEHISWLEGAGCDSHLFCDDDGKIYAIMPFGNEYIQEADLSNIENGDIKLIGERKMIVARDNSDVGKTFSPEYMEAPWMIKRNGKYILFTGSPYRKPENDKSFTPDLEYGYWVGVATADNIWGPYKKEPQIFLGGHIAVFEGPDGKEWFSYRGESGGKSQGLLCIDPIPFNANGTISRFEPTTGPVTIQYRKNTNE